MPTQLFKKGNQMAKLKGKHTLSVALLKNDKALLAAVIKKAINGDTKCLLWLLEKKHGKNPVNPIKLQGGESSEQLLEILKENIDKLPVEILTSMQGLINTNIEVKEMVEVEGRINALEHPQKKKSKKKRKKKRKK